MRNAYPPRFTGPWEVEEDISLDDIEARRRPNHRIHDEGALPTRFALREAAHLRAYGVTDRERLADFLDLTVEAFETRIASHLPAQLSPADQRFHDAFERAIASGRTFTSDALPTPERDTYGMSLIQAAHRAGRIVKAPGSNSYVRYWQSPEGYAADQAAKVNAA